MKIGIDGRDLEGQRTGVGVYVDNILRAWERLGVLTEHEVITFHKDEIPDDLPRHVRGVLTKPLFGVSSTALFTHLLLPRAARLQSVDILFSPGYIIPLAWRGRSAVTLHDIIYEAHPDWFNFQSRADYILLKRLSRRSAKRADRILTPSHFSASEISSHYDVAPYSITVTPLGADPAYSTVRDVSQEEAILRKYNIDGQFLFTVGTMQSRRHIPDDIAAFERVATTITDIHYLIGGRNMTDPHVDIEGLIKETNERLGRDAVHYTPYVAQEELPHLYRAASGLLWLSDYEGYGLPPIEAMASGIPVITSNASCLPETVGTCAILIENNDDRDLIANAIERIFTDDQLQHRLAECGPRRAAQFSWDNCARLTLDALVAATNA